MSKKIKNKKMLTDKYNFIKNITNNKQNREISNAYLIFRNWFNDAGFDIKIYN